MKNSNYITEDELVQLIKNKLNEDLGTSLTGLSTRIRTGGVFGKGGYNKNPATGEMLNPSLEADVAKVLELNQRLNDEISKIQIQYSKVWNKQQIESKVTKNRQQRRFGGDYVNDNDEESNRFVERIEAVNTQVESIKKQMETLRNTIQAFSKSFAIQGVHY
jgi:chromosome segregation ATPase